MVKAAVAVPEKVVGFQYSAVLALADRGAKKRRVASLADLAYFALSERAEHPAPSARGGDRTTKGGAAVVGERAAAVAAAWARAVAVAADWGMVVAGAY